MPETTTAPQVSIIVPVYNIEDYLARCLASIQAQTLKNWECICVDDGSTDGSSCLLDEWAARDARFIVIHQQNGGTSAARNTGMAAARAEYIGFVDHDDWIESETYQIALDAARRTGADIVQWAYVDKTKTKSTCSKKRSEGFFSIAQEPEYYSVPVWNKLFKSSLAKKHSFPPAARMGGEDICFSIMTYLDAKKCYYLDRVFYWHDISHETLSARKQTPKVIMEYVGELKRACDYAEQKVEGRGKKEIENISLILLLQKLEAKRRVLVFLPKPDYRLFSSIFPEANKKALPCFLKTRTRQSFKLLLAACHLEALTKAIVRIKKTIRELACNASAQG